MAKSNDLFKDFILRTPRHTVINWPNKVLDIVDGYREHRGIDHGVQKDCIQNAWDARLNKRHGKGWSLIFELLRDKSGRTFLTMTDKGTTGLTGRVLQAEELQEDLLPEERWGRFENVAFTKGPSEETLGSRGKGKFIFVGASENYTILYDTLRADGIYRFGYRTVKLTDSPIDAYDGDEGKKLLVKLTDGVLTPLSEIGTRVIIVNPINDVVRSIESGSFLRFIGETWWEIISKFSKYGVQIIVRQNGSDTRAKIPEEFVLPETDSGMYKVWLKKEIKIKYTGEQYMIKRLHIIRKTTSAVPDDIRGVAIQRGGMKICPLYIRYVPQEIADSVYGYITFDKKLDKAVLVNEGSEHYSYDFSRGLIRKINLYIEDELGKFARAKLGCGADPRKIEHERQTNAERRAIYKMNRVIKKLGLFGGKGGGGRGNDGNGAVQEKRQIRIEMEPMQFPRESRRINWGESLKNIIIWAVNDTDKSIPVQLKIYMLYHERDIHYFLKEKDFTLKSYGRSKKFGPFHIEFNKKDFPGKGPYTIRAKLELMANINNKKKGYELHILSKRFYLEEDPPEGGLFEKCEGLGFPEEQKLIMGEAISGKSKYGYIFQYNLDHPAKKASDDTEDHLTDYLFRIMANEVPRIDIRREERKIFSDEDLKVPMRLSQEISRLIGKIMHEYYVS